MITSTFGINDWVTSIIRWSIICLSTLSSLEFPSFRPRVKRVCHTWVLAKHHREKIPKRSASCSTRPVDLFVVPPPPSTFLLLLTITPASGGSIFCLRKVKRLTSLNTLSLWWKINSRNELAAYVLITEVNICLSSFLSFSDTMALGANLL